MTFNRKKFFDLYDQAFGRALSRRSKAGLEFLLDQIENDSTWRDIRHIAYALATTAHETAWSYQPVEEGYYLGDLRKVKTFQKGLRYYPYYGRGYVQLTWKKNYEKAGAYLGANLVDMPNLALAPGYAYKILTVGMHKGWFSGKKLSDFINDTRKDYKGARQIINGTDKAGQIGSYAQSFEDILRKSKEVPQPVADSAADFGPGAKPEPVSGGATDSAAPVQAPPPVSTDKEPDGSIGDTASAAADAATTWLNKAGNIQEGVSRVSFLSRAGRFIATSTPLVITFLTSNWEIFLVVLLLTAIAAWYLFVVRPRRAGGSSTE